MLIQSSNLLCANFICLATHYAPRQFARRYKSGSAFVRFIPPGHKKSYMNFGLHLCSTKSLIRSESNSELALNLESNSELDSELALNLESNLELDSELHSNSELHSDSMAKS